MNAVEKWNELVPHGNLGSWKFSMRLKCQTRDEEFERICATFSATARFLSQTKLLKIPAENLKKVQYFGSWRRGWSWTPEMNREIAISKSSQCWEWNESWKGILCKVWFRKL